MIPFASSLLDCVSCSTEDKHLGPADYGSSVPRWCPGCGDHSVLTAVQRLLADENLPPERTVFVSGIGCSSRLPHYLKTYGFHGIHGRALPIATGVKLHRPDLNVFAVMGDGDCCSIGAGHWIHAIRYNMDITVLLLDNCIYALTKDQTSPTTPQGYASNTQPKGSWLPPLNPLTVTLGVTNASFVAQTAEWVPSHLFETLKAARAHRGFSFVRILQRCPVFTPDIFQKAVRDPGQIELLVHDDGIPTAGLENLYKNRQAHDPRDLHGARRLAEFDGKFRLGLFFKDASAPRYEETRHLPVHTAQERMDLLDREFDRYAV
ncbi:MAG: 2-oxoglutarate oxidoreductase [Planctomycetes bacterium]|nr:2-oxoglutarate oxidoreductase [Planctomycetota bacterium]